VTNFSGVVILTGASGGIGRATAVALAELGFTLALVGRSVAELTITLEQVQAIGGQAQLFVQDLTEYARLGALVERIHTELGAITGLVNSAGMVQVQPLEQMAIGDWERLMALNLTAVFALTQQVIPRLRANGGGVIVNLASIAGLRTFPGWGAYCATKFGLVALGRTLAEELRADQIRVCTLCPGAVATPLWDTVAGDFNRAKMLDPQTVAQVVVQAFTLPAHAVLEEVILMPAGGAL